MKIRIIAAAVASLAFSFGSAAQAQSTTVNLSATTLASVTDSFAAGTYNISWIDNTAHQGYNGWSAATPASSAGYREAFSLSLGTAPLVGTTYTYDVVNSGHYATFATATAALTAFQTGSLAMATGSSYSQPGTFSAISSATFTLTQAGSVTFFLPDTSGWDNTGGVSLSITPAVPEPETYALMLAGLGALGFVARRRKQR